MEKNEFGFILRTLREQAGLNQRELAEKVGIDFSYLSKIENGVLPPPSQEVILKLATVLKADRDELLASAGKVPFDIAQILKNQGVLQSLREGNAARQSAPNNKQDSFGKRLKELRERSGLSQGDLAGKVGVSFTYLSKIENGVKPPPSEKVILKLAAALSSDKDDLMALAGKVPSDIAPILKNREVRQSLRQSNARNIMSGSGNRKGERIMSMMKPLFNGRSLVRVALAVVLVIAVAASLWYSSPATVRALKVDITNPSGAPLDAGTLGQTYFFQVKTTVQNLDRLTQPVASLSIVNSTNSSYQAILSGLPWFNGSIDYTTGQTGGGSANVSVVTTNLTWDETQTSGYVVFQGQGYALPTGYGYKSLVGTATITYNIGWTPPSGWPAGTYNMSALINVGGNTFIQGPTAFALQTGLLAETGISQAVSTSVTDVIVALASINRFKNPSDNSTANITGGVGSYSATVLGNPAGAVQFMAVVGVAPFTGASFNATTGVFSATSTSPAQANNTPVAEVVTSLTGNVTTPVTVTTNFQSIVSATVPTLVVPGQIPNTITLLRGDSKVDGAIDIFDALFIAQYIVGQKTLSQIGAINAASVKHDGTGGEKIDIFDALFIAQYIVGQKNAYFQ